MASTHLQLRLRIRGAHVDPEWLTSATSITPSRSFHIGEKAGGATSAVAGWEWRSEWASDDRALFDEMLRVFESHASVLAACAEHGGHVWLAVAGEEVDRVALSMRPEIVQFLARIHGAIVTHIDVELAVSRDEPAPGI